MDCTSSLQHGLHVTDRRPHGVPSRAIARGLAAIVAGALGLIVVAACQPPLLNSERIAARYGSYAITVLYQDDGERVSSLESRHADGNIARTLAVVQFADALPADLRPLHARVLAGESIGATFKAAGWSIEKPLLCLDEIRLPDSAATRRMRIGLPANVALHAYRFVLTRHRQPPVPYAVIAEVHHPDYLALADLRSLHAGPADADDCSRLRPHVTAALSRPSER